MKVILCVILYGYLLAYTVKFGKESGISPLLCILGTVLLGPLMLVFVLMRRPKSRKERSRRNSRRAFAGFFKESVPLEDLGEQLQDWQRGISAFLYISLLAHGIEVFLTNVDVLTGIVPALQVISAVSALVFFVAECVLMPPVGVIIMTALATVLFYVIPYIVAFVAGLFTGSILLLLVGGFIAVLSMGVVIVVVDGVIVSAMVVPMIVTPFMMGFAATAATAAASAAAVYAVDAGVQKVTTSELVRPKQVLVNLVMLFVLIWPALTWFDVCPGMFALKPVQRAQQQYRSFSDQYTSSSYENFFTDEGRSYINGEKNFAFRNHFYDQYIYPARNTFAQGATPSASMRQYIAFSLNGLIYLTDTEKNEVYHVTAYALEPEDAMLMVGQEVFVFCHDRILLLGPDGRYLWKDTKWTSDFEDLSRDEQYDKLYSILEEQNSEQSVSIGIDDVAMVAYAQRNGILLYYDSAAHSAWFAQEGKDGEITILRQSAAGTRAEAAVFTPNCDSENLPYTMINSTVVAYIDDDQIIFRGVGEDWRTVHYTNKTHDGETHPFVSFHVLHDEDGNEYFAYQDSEDMICLELLGRPVKEAYFDASKYDAVYSVGTYVYAIVYDSDDLINRVTYANDLKDDESITQVWTENWSWDRIHLQPELWGIEEVVETIPWEELPFEERYPCPELNTSVRQIGLYKDNVASPSQYAYYRGPVKGFNFRFPRILYNNVEYTWSEDETEIRIHFYNTDAPSTRPVEDDPSTLTVTLRPNAEGIDHQTLMAELLKAAKEEMSDEKTMRSGLDNEEGSASSFYLKGYDPNNTNLIYTRLCRVDDEYIMEMELRVPRATSDEDKAYKDFYIIAMEAVCGFGSGDEYTPFWKFKKNRGL